MNKTDIIHTVSRKAGVPQTITTEIIDSFLDTIVESLASGDHVTLTGFGTFTVKHCDQRQGRNIRTGEPVTIPAKAAPTFRPSPLFKGRFK